MLQAGRTAEFGLNNIKLLYNPLNSNTRFYSSTLVVLCKTQSLLFFSLVQQ